MTSLNERFGVRSGAPATLASVWPKLLLYRMRKSANFKTKTRFKVDGYSNYLHDSRSPVNECYSLRNYQQGLFPTLPNP